MISERCFDFTLVAIDPGTAILDNENDSLMSQLSLMNEVYTDTFWDNLGFVFLSDSHQGYYLF